MAAMRHPTWKGQAHERGGDREVRAGDGAEYALDDLLVYAFYGHKREHSAQVAVYRDRIRR